MAIVSIATLKSYFETGDKPTQAQFVDLIDTLASLPDLLTEDELAAINGANNPDAGNVFATMDDIVAGGGNTIIQTISVASLTSLQLAGTISTTTIYIVTDASPFVLKMQFKANNQNVATATLMDDTYSGSVLYTVSTGNSVGNRICDASGNIWNGVLPSATTLGTSCARNTFEQGSSLTVGNSAIDNTFGAKISGFTFGNGLQYVTVEAGLSGGDYTASPDYDFLYGNSYPSTIFRSGGINYHRYFDVANDRIVIRDLATPTNITYIGSNDHWDTRLVSGSLTAHNSTQYMNVASATYTDPSPVEGEGFKVYVRNGTATVGGVGYSAAGSVIWRVYHSGAWASYLTLDKTANDATYASKTFVESLSLQDGGTSIAATTYTLELYAAYAYTINELKIISGAGTCTAAVQINGTPVTGISAVSVSTSIATGTATAANTVAVGDKITLVTTSNSGLNNLQASLKTTRI
jgi:hypothetical protein